jgi:hypothetical protein
VLPRTVVTWPLVAFTAFVLLGFMRGLLRGANLQIAIIEGRALLYIILAFLIIANECVEPRHYRHALWAVLAGVTIQSLLSIQYYSGLSEEAKDALTSLNEHGSVLGQNLVFITLGTCVVFGIRAGLVKWTLLLAAIPTAYVSLVSQRRAGIAALGMAWIFLAVALLWRRKKAFWVLVPVLTLAVAGYLVAFWNSSASIAFPAQAVKSVVSPGEASAEDQSSDLYRIIETYNLNATIRSSPLGGLGFGVAFYRPVPLPDISMFGMNAFIPHNNILWIWIKTGFGGFAAMFYLFAKGILAGANRVRSSRHDVDLVVAMAATTYLAMFLVYSYVDVSWDARNVVMLALALATCSVPVTTRDSETMRDSETTATRVN